MVITKQRLTPYEAMRARGVDRRTFLALCTKATAFAGLSAAMVPDVVRALETQRRIPVIWLHGLECTGCSESLLRSSNPTVQDVILSAVSLEYHNTLQAAAGFQAEEIRQQVMRKSPGEYLLAVEGAVPTNGRGGFCTVGGESFVRVLQETAAQALAVVAYGACAANGGVQSAAPNPTGARSVSAVITRKPVINVPGCPPIAEVMTGVIVYYLTYKSLPALDTYGRPLPLYGNTVHEACPRRSYFDFGQFVQSWDDEGARKGWCLYRMGCRGPSSFGKCTELGWNEGWSSCPQSGHPCIGCSEQGFWDARSIYPRPARPQGDDTEHESRIGG